MVFRFKCYSLPFVGWWDGNVDKYSLFDFFHVILYILSQYVQNYRPTHEQTTILLDQLQKHFLVISHVPGGGGVYYYCNDLPNMTFLNEMKK